MVVAIMANCGKNAMMAKREAYFDACVEDEHVDDDGDDDHGTTIAVVISTN